jgi:3-oxoacyl-[acyl-carrier-protein] synthase-1
MNPLAVIGCGMLTGVGLDAPSSCAAIRSGIDNFTETHFHDPGGEPITASLVPLPGLQRGRDKLVQMAAAAVRECLASAGATAAEGIPLLLCLSEAGRPGRMDGLDDTFLADLQKALGLRFHARSAAMAAGRAGGALAIRTAAEILASERLPFCLVAGVDSFIPHLTLIAYAARRRLLTSRNSNGFLPGEAAGAVLLCPAASAGKPHLAVTGFGAGAEKAAIESEQPLRAEGLVAAVRAALADARTTMAAIDYRIADLNGEQYGFKEAALAATRLVRERKAEFEIWHPADCIGEVGAATVPILLAFAATAARNGYAPGPQCLCHVANDDGARAALVLKYQT